MSNLSQYTTMCQQLFDKCFHICLAAFKTSMAGIIGTSKTRNCANNFNSNRLHQVLSGRSNKVRSSVSYFFLPLFEPWQACKGFQFRLLYNNVGHCWPQLNDYTGKVEPACYFLLIDSEKWTKNVLSEHQTFQWIVVKVGKCGCDFELIKDELRIGSPIARRFVFIRDDIINTFLQVIDINIYEAGVSRQCW